MIHVMNDEWYRKIMEVFTDYQEFERFCFNHNIRPEEFDIDKYNGELGMDIDLDEILVDKKCPFMKDINKQEKNNYDPKTIRGTGDTRYMKREGKTISITESFRKCIGKECMSFRDNKCLLIEPPQPSPSRIKFINNKIKGKTKRAY